MTTIRHHFNALLLAVLIAIFGVTSIVNHAVADSGASFWNARKGFFSYHKDVYELLEKRSPIGSPFTRHLFNMYRNLVYDPQDIYEFNGKAKHHFARKAVIAGEGDVVLPETLAAWSTIEHRKKGFWGFHNAFLDLMQSGVDSFSDGQEQPLKQAHDKLNHFLNMGAREFAPKYAAQSQFYFDCWIGAAAGNAPPLTLDICRERHLTAMSDLVVVASLYQPDDIIRTPPNPPVVEDTSNARQAAREEEANQPAPKVRKAPVIPLEDAKYFVFFDFDKSTLDTTAMRVLDAAAREIKNRNDVATVVIVGHTDTSGSNDYNRALSFRRAREVRKALTERGVASDKTRIRALGENSLLVKTADGVKEPANRRAEITFE